MRERRSGGGLASRLVAVTGAVCVMLVPGVLVAQATRIVAVDGEPVDATAGAIEVRRHPGAVIQLSADLVRGPGSAPQLEGRPGDEFVWTSTMDPSRPCEPAAGCYGGYFEVTPYGVALYMPYDAPGLSRITVTHVPSGGTETMSVVNPLAGYYSDASRRATIYTDGDAYPAAFDLDFHVALQGQGNWLFVLGTEVFVPYAPDADWAPYTRGRWLWSRWGWMWHSHDPWGWVTDHHGYWRHHETYGWVWTAFSWTGSSAHWYPFVGSFFTTASHIGWTPYWDYWDERTPGYTRGRGFDDGFERDWDASDAGLVAVQRERFGAPDLATLLDPLRVARRERIEAIGARTYIRGAQVYGDRDAARVFGVATASETPLRAVRTRVGGVRGVNVRPNPPIDDLPSAASSQRTVLTARMADQAAVPRLSVGTIVGPDGSLGAPPAPRGVAAAPMTWDPLESTCRHASLSIL